MHGNGDHCLGLGIATPTATDPLMGSLSPMSPAATSAAATLAVPSVVISLVAANSRSQYDSSCLASQEEESLRCPPLSLGHYPEVMQGVSHIIDVPTTPSTGAESAQLQSAFVEKIAPTSPRLESNGVYSTYPLLNEGDTVYQVRIITIVF
jgi:hypothetical protein